MIRLAVRCPPDHADRVLAELLELVPGGVEEERGEAYVEFAVYGAPGELPAIGDLDASAGEGVVEVSSSEIPDDWSDRWRDFHTPVVVRDRIRVRPSWVEVEAGAELVEVVIDPAQAFGTGAHGTTRLCLELLLDLADSGHGAGSLGDWGTGSGVLAIAAAKLGWGPVAGCDHELAALEAAAANARANDVELELERVNLREQAPPLAPVAVANLTAPVLVGIAARLGGPGDEPRTLVCSGLLEGEADEVSAAFGARGFAEHARLAGGEWAALLLVR